MDADFFNNGEKNLRFRKYPGTFEQGPSFGSLIEHYLAEQIKNVCALRPSLSWLFAVLLHSQYLQTNVIPLTQDISEISIKVCIACNNEQKRCWYRLKVDTVLRSGWRPSVSFAPFVKWLLLRFCHLENTVLLGSSNTLIAAMWPHYSDPQPNANNFVCLFVSRSVHVWTTEGQPCEEKAASWRYDTSCVDGAYLQRRSRARSWKGWWWWRGGGGGGHKGFGRWTISSLVCKCRIKLPSRWFQTVSRPKKAHFTRTASDSARLGRL